ncbi:MAG: hypothetical protein RI601_12480, partial [Desulfurivibrionaceae bacterium]|nr:hypothetical protein [Desulfurivibrionaceae bacterium]
MAATIADYKVGDVYGHWTIIGPAEKYRSGSKRVTCRCRCGKEKILMLTSIATGKSTQCTSCANQRTRASRVGMKFNGLEVIDTANN